MNDEHKAALLALAFMWNQYCGKNGHLFMTAGEHASEVLMQAGLLVDEYSEVDDEKIDALCLSLHSNTGV